MQELSSLKQKHSQKLSEFRMFENIDKERLAGLLMPRAQPPSVDNEELTTLYRVKAIIKEAKEYVPPARLNRREYFQKHKHLSIYGNVAIQFPRFDQLSKEMPATVPTIGQYLQAYGQAQRSMQNCQKNLKSIIEGMRQIQIRLDYVEQSLDVDLLLFNKEELEAQDVLAAQLQEPEEEDSLGFVDQVDRFLRARLGCVQPKI